MTAPTCEVEIWRRDDEYDADGRRAGCRTITVKRDVSALAQIRGLLDEFYAAIDTEADEPNPTDDGNGSYGDLSLEDLRAELKERGLNRTGATAVLVKRLEKDDAENEEEL